MEVLQHRPQCSVFVSTADWLALGRFIDLTRPSTTSIHDVGDADLAMLAVRMQAFILTDRPERYTRIVPSVETIPLEPPWN